MTGVTSPISFSPDVKTIRLRKTIGIWFFLMVANIDGSGEKGDCDAQASRLLRLRPEDPPGA